MDRRFLLRQVGGTVLASVVIGSFRWVDGGVRMTTALAIGRTLGWMPQPQQQVRMSVPPPEQLEALTSQAREVFGTPASSSAMRLAVPAYSGPDQALRAFQGTTVDWLFRYQRYQPDRLPYSVGELLMVAQGAQGLFPEGFSAAAQLRDDGVYVLDPSLGVWVLSTESTQELYRLAGGALVIPPNDDDWQLRIADDDGNGDGGGGGGGGGGDSPEPAPAPAPAPPPPPPPAAPAPPPAPGSATATQACQRQSAACVIAPAACHFVTRSAREAGWVCGLMASQCMAVFVNC